MISQLVSTSPTRRMLIALVVGLGVGAAISASGDPRLLLVASFAEPIGTVWVSALRMTVVPLVVSMLIVAITSAGDAGTVGKTGAKAYAVFFIMLGASALFAALAVPPLLAGMPSAGSPMVSSDTVAATAVIQGVRKLPTFGEWVVSLIPVNPIRAAADGDLLPLMIFTVLFGTASTRTPSEVRQPICNFFRGVGSAMLVLVGWVIALAPIGVFALMLPLAARMGASAAGAVGYYVLVTTALLMVGVAALYAVAVIVARVPLGHFAKAILPAQAVALSTRSSLASLPALIAGAERLDLPPALSGFVLPLAVSTFKLSAPITWIAGAVFLARLYGVPLGASDIALVAAASVVLSMGTPGIPSGGILFMAPLYTSFGIPAEGIGILIAIDYLPDVGKTVLNVTGDMAATAIIARIRTVSQTISSTISSTT